MKFKHLSNQRSLKLLTDDNLNGALSKNCNVSRIPIDCSTEEP